VNDQKYGKCGAYRPPPSPRVCDLTCVCAHRHVHFVVDTFARSCYNEHVTLNHTFIDNRICNLCACRSFVTTMHLTRHKRNDVIKMKIVAHNDTQQLTITLNDAKTTFNVSYDDVIRAYARYTKSIKREKQYRERQTKINNAFASMSFDELNEFAKRHNVNVDDLMLSRKRKNNT
jgi:hypothetical protein